MTEQWGGGCQGARDVVSDPGGQLRSCVQLGKIHQILMMNSSKFIILICELFIDTLYMYM